MRPKPQPPLTLALLPLLALSVGAGAPGGQSTCPAPTPAAPYPSRHDCVEPNTLWPRADPVVHASAAEQAHGPLQPAQLAAYQRDGFLQV